MAYLAAVDSSTIPIFIRTKGDVPPLDFPAIGSLHSVHLFTSKLQASLISCSTSGSQVIWRQYCDDNINLILVTADTSASDLHCRHMLDLIFNAMVLLVGLHLLESMSSVEMLKKELKCAYPLIDLIFKGEHSLMSPLTQVVDVMALDNIAILTKAMEAFTEAAKSSFGCLTMHHRICTASESWWGLSSLETCLLSLLLYSLSPASSYDIPVYLPKASNKIPHRLIAFTLLDDVHLIILCNPEPPLNELHKLIPLYWSSLAAQLRNSSRLYPRCVHLGVCVETSILAFCLVNTEAARGLTSLKPNLSEDYQATTLMAGYHGELKLEKKLLYLTKFYKLIAEDFVPSVNSNRDKISTALASSTLCHKLPHRILDTYICSKHYKAYAMSRGKYNLFALFAVATPTFALKKFTASLYDRLLQNKSIAII